MASPDLAVSYAFVEVKLMNHAKKGITQLDFDLAKKIDEFILWNPVEENLSLDGTPDDPRFAYVKRKNRNKCIYSSMLSPFVKVDNDFSFKPNHFNYKNKSSDKLTLEQTQLKVKSTYSEAVKEIKK